MASFRSIPVVTAGLPVVTAGLPGVTAGLPVVMAGFLWSLAGCGVASDVDVPDDTDEALVGCIVVEEVPLAVDEPSPLGFTADDVLLFAEGSHPATLTWAGEGGVTGLTVSLVWEGGARYQRREWRQAGNELAFDPECGDIVALDVLLTLTTEDGALAETTSTTLHTADGQRATFGFERSPDTLEGTYTVTEVDTSRFDEVRLFFEGTVDAAGTTGTVGGQGSGVEGDPGDPDSVAFAESFDVAAWGAPITR